MRLRPAEFTADSEDPFGSDRLSRRQHVEALCRILTTVEGHLAVSLDAPWGAVKTAFVKMCCAQLRSEGVKVVDFNAWRQSHTGDPLVDLVAAISEQIKGTKIEAVKQAAASLAWHAAQVATRGLVDRDAVETGVPEMFAPWAEAEKQAERFTCRLAKAASSGGGPLVVLIDELDRCRPLYALSLLETVRHLFAADGVMVVMAINRDELRQSVESVYGPDFDSDRYLRRFADLSISLPPPDDQNLAGFLDSLLDTTGLSDRFTASGQHNSAVLLRMVAEAPGCSLRDLEQAVQHAVVVLASLSPPSGPHDHRLQALEHAAVALIVLRALDQGAYQRIALGEDDGFAAIAALYQALGLSPEPADKPAHRNRTLELMEAVLIVGTNGDRPAGQDSQQDLAKKYVEATKHSTEAADLIFEVCGELRSRYMGRGMDFGVVTPLIDLAAHTPTR